MYLSTKDLQAIEQAIKEGSTQKIEVIIRKYKKEQKKVNEKMKHYMKEKRKENKNYGNHYTYKDGRRR